MNQASPQIATTASARVATAAAVAPAPPPSLPLAPAPAPAMAVAGTAAAAAATEAVHQLSDSEGEETDEEGSSTSSAQESEDTENSAELQDSDLEEEEQEEIPRQQQHLAGAAAAEEPLQPEEPQHPSSSSQGIHSSHPSPAPPPSVPPDGSQTQQQTIPMLSSASNVEDSDSNTVEMANTLGVAGPSTSAVPLSSTPKKQSADAATAPPSPESNNEGQTCPICFNPWTSKGDHRLSSLTCGHLFGYECISKWLQGTTKRNMGNCPLCNTKVTKMDIHNIYAKNIKALDTTEKEKIMKELEKEREEKRRLEVERAQVWLKYELKSQLVVKLQEELEALKALASGAHHVWVSSSKPGQSSSLKKRMVFKKSMELCREGGCRVMAYSKWIGMVVVSTAIPGHGVKKIDLFTFQVIDYVPLHQNQIRDLAFCPTKPNLLLSVGLDQLVKVTNISSKAFVVQFLASAPVWCCSWSTTKMTVFYVGTVFGHLLQYDTQITSGPVAIIELPGSGPAVSMTYIHPDPDSSLTRDGLLVTCLKSCFFVEAGTPEAKSHQLPLDGIFTSMSRGDYRSHVLVSCRPTKHHPRARHTLCFLHQVTSSEEGEAERQTVTTQPVCTFLGGTTQKLLTRSILASPPFPGCSPLVFTSDESTRKIYVWELESMSCLQQLVCPDVVLDLLQVTIRQTSYLMALTEKGVRVYSWG